MPLTPFHHPVAYAIYKLDRRLSLPGLVVGSMFPDLEIPIIFLLYHDLSFHFPEDFSSNSLILTNSLRIFKLVYSS
ncbi:MAG: DUF4184 family protein [archaeon]|nr:DUF4184 family protein [archaeon]MCP8306592.1 DUF4184 family protein [archaeon]